MYSNYVGTLSHGRTALLNVLNANKKKERMNIFAKKE